MNALRHPLEEFGGSLEVLRRVKPWCVNSLVAHVSTRLHWLWMADSRGQCIAGSQIDSQAHHGDP